MEPKVGIFDIMYRYHLYLAVMLNKKNLLIGIAILLTLIVGIIFFVDRNNKNKVQEISNTANSIKEESYNEDEEEVEIEHNLKLSIIGPEDEKIYPSQARMYNALVKGNGKYTTTVKCHWDFFLDENNEEVLYKVMDNEGVLYGESKELCGFTSTFMDKVGKLRVVLTMTVYDVVDDNLETVTAEREYVVAK